MIQTMQELNEYCKFYGKIAVFHAGKLCGIGYEGINKELKPFDLKELGIGACDYQTIKRCKE